MPIHFPFHKKSTQIKRSIPPGTSGTPGSAPPPEETTGTEFVSQEGVRIILPESPSDPSRTTDTQTQQYEHPVDVASWIHSVIEEKVKEVDSLRRQKPGTTLDDFRTMCQKFFVPRLTELYGTMPRDSNAGEWAEDFKLMVRELIRTAIWRTEWTKGGFYVGNGGDESIVPNSSLVPVQLPKNIFSMTLEEEQQTRYGKRLEDYPTATHIGFKVTKGESPTSYLACVPTFHGSTAKTRGND